MLNLSREGMGENRPDPSETADFTEISAPLTWSRYFHGMWEARDFIWTLSHSRLHAANQGTVLGMLWYLANPLLTAGIFLLVFGYILQVARGQGDYPAFLVIGIFTFSFGSRAIIGGATSPRQGDRLLSNLFFPRLVLPVAALIQEALAFIPAMLAMMVLVLATGGRPHFTWLLTPVVLILQGLFALGVATMLAPVTYRYRDVEQILPFLMRMWMYLSGVFYGLDLVRDRGGDTIAAVFAANPMFAFMDLNRSFLLRRPPESGSPWAVAIGWTVVTLLVGLVVYRANEHEFGHG